jgi:hypothetical protein
MRSPRCRDVLSYPHVTKWRSIGQFRQWGFGSRPVGGHMKIYFTALRVLQFTFPGGRTPFTNRKLFLAGSRLEPFMTSCRNPLRRKRSRCVRDRSRARMAPAPSPVWRFRRISRDCASFSGGLAMAAFLQASCFYYPIVLRFIYTIALYDYYPITLYIFILLCRERTGPARLEVRPRTPLQIS